MKYLILAALLIGCSNPVTVQDSQPKEQSVSFPIETVVSEPARLSDITVCLYDVPEENQQAIITGITAWAEVLKPWRTITVNSFGSNCNVTVYEIGKHSGLCASEDACGCTHQIGGMTEDSVNTEIFLYKGNYESFATGTVMHELGHLLGLTHKEGGLMQAHWNQEWADPFWIYPDQDTLNRLEKVLHTPI